MCFAIVAMTHESIAWTLCMKCDFLNKAFTLE